MNRASGDTLRMAVHHRLPRKTVSDWVVGMLATGCGSDASEMSPDLPEWSLSAMVLVQPEQVPSGRVADLAFGDDGSVVVLEEGIPGVASISTTNRLKDVVGQRLVVIRDPSSPPSKDSGGTTHQELELPELIAPMEPPARGCHHSSL